MTDTLTPTEDAMEAVQAVQADRDAAVELSRAIGAGTPVERWAIATEQDDEHPAVQAFARHRLAHTQAPPREPSGAMVEARKLIFDSLYQLRNDELAQRYHNRACNWLEAHPPAALTTPGPATAVADARERARELLAEACDEAGLVQNAANVRERLDELPMPESGVKIAHYRVDIAAALRAIERALAAREALAEAVTALDAFRGKGEFPDFEAWEAKARALLANTVPARSYGEDAGRTCTVCKAVVATYPEGMCCHCQELPWPLTSKADTPDSQE